MNTYRNFIGGKWIESSSTRTAQNINPANTDDILGTIRQATREEARSAVEAAAGAFRSWRATPAPARGRIVAKAARLLEENKEEVAQLLTHEEGKTIAESRGELQRSINVAEFCAGESRRMNGETIPSELPLNFAYTIKQPLGVVACVTPWNFPVAIPIWKIAPALVAGNTVVFKPASITPATAVRITELFEAAGIPPGVLNLVLGSGSEAGDEIINHPAVKAISFTGSNGVGIRLYEQASRRGAKVQCEMGGKNPVVVLEDDSVSRDQRGCDLPHGNRDREVPRRNTRDDAKRLLDRIGEVQRQLGRDRFAVHASRLTRAEFSNIDRALQLTA